MHSLRSTQVQPNDERAVPGKQDSELLFMPVLLFKHSLHKNQGTKGLKGYLHCPDQLFDSWSGHMPRFPGPLPEASDHVSLSHQCFSLSKNVVCTEGGGNTSR